MGRRSPREEEGLPSVKRKRERGWVVGVVGSVFEWVDGWVGGWVVELTVVRREVILSRRAWWSLVFSWATSARFLMTAMRLNRISEEAYLFCLG